MKLIAMLLVFLAVAFIVSAAAQKSGKLNESANKAVSGMAACARYFIHGALAFLGFAFAMYVAHAFFAWP